MRTILKLTGFLFVAGHVFFACKKHTDTTSRPTTGSAVPVAHAGTDQTIVLPVDSVELDGSGTDADGTIRSFLWTKVTGPHSFTIANRNAATTMVKNLVQGIYEFELEVKDNDGLSAKDTVAISVSNGPSGQIGNYRSMASGEWDDASSWEEFDGNNWINSSGPPSPHSQIHIRAGHTIAISTAAAAREVVVDENGVLVILTDFSLTERLTNNGTLYWQNGTLSLLGAYSLVTLHNNGNLIIDGNNETWSYWWDSEVQIINNGVLTKTSTGHTSLEAAHSVFNTPNGILRGLGTLSVSGNIDWLPEAFNNQGTISPGLPVGSFAVHKVLQPFTTGSTLQLEILDNSGPGTGNDQLVFDSDVTLRGNLIVTEIGPSVASGNFTVISTTGAIKGNFSNTDLPPGYVLEVNSNSVKLVK